MPLFEYQCKGCDHQFEALVSSERTPVCPECDGEELEKLLAGFAVGGSQPNLPTPGSCGSCGDPRGPGACRL